MAASIAYLSKEIDDKGLENHPCRDIVKGKNGVVHLHIGKMGNKMESHLVAAMMNAPCIDERTEDTLADLPVMEIKYFPPTPMPDLPKHKDNSFRHHGKGTYKKFGKR